MKAARIVWSIVGVLSVSVAVRGTDPVVILAPSEAGGFVRGHIFVAMQQSEACDFGGREWIIEIDPDTGDWSIFADSDDGICVVSGLRFTPDGSRLLAANAGRLSPFNDGGWIQAFNPDGSSEIILDASDGLNRPYGANCLAFDSGGDLYVLSAESSTILRFPRDGSPATLFADYSDGIDGRGPLEFSPGGDLFYSGVFARATIRINPQAQAVVFQGGGGFSGLASDRQGNLFGATGAGLVRYDGPDPDPTTRRILATGFCCEAAIALSPDDRSLYYAETFGRVYAIDPDTGASRLIADFSELSSYFFPTGATVYAPDPDLIPGRCCFSAGTSAHGCVDGVTRPQCGDDEPGPFLFTPKANCPPEGSDCEPEPVAVACCHGDPFVPCTDGTPVSECLCPSCTWDQFRRCAEIECPESSIPTTSTWGLTAMSLSLMIGAKIVFGHGAGTGAKCATV